MWIELDHAFYTSLDPVSYNIIGLSLRTIRSNWVVFGINLNLPPVNTQYELVSSFKEIFLKTPFVKIQN